MGLAYVFVSSWFGLNGTPILQGDFGGRIKFFVDVWTDSLLADGVFFVGTLAAGVGALWLLQQFGVIASVVGSLLANTFVYGLSYLFLGDIAHPQVSGVVESFAFVVEWGWPGLIVAAGLPVVAVYLARRWGLGDPLQGHEIEFG